MRRVNIKTIAEITEFTEEKGLHNSYKVVTSTDLKHFPYYEGVVSLKFHYVTEIFYDNIIIRNLISPNAKTYYYGSFTSVEDLERQNVSGQNNDLIAKLKKIETVSGIVTSSQGYISMVGETDNVLSPVINEKIKKKR